MTKRFTKSALALLASGVFAGAAGQAVIGPAWVELGPKPLAGPNSGSPSLSGQVSAIAVDKDHDPSGNSVYVGSSSGGLWMSTNGFMPKPHFVPLSDQTQSLSVGSVALNTRTMPPTIYVGSGAPDNSANVSSYTGVGMFISHDGGQSWQLVDSADGGLHPFKGMGFSSILIDGLDPTVMLASTPQ